MPYDSEDDWEDLRSKILGFGEKSVRKNYYSELQENIEGLRRFRTLLNQTEDIILLVNLSNFLLSDFNSSASFQLGFSCTELKYKSFFDLIMPEDHIKFKSMFSDDDFKTKILNKRINTYFVKKNKKLIPVEVAVHVVKFDEDYYMVLVGRDVSVNVKAEMELEESKTYYKALFESTGAATAVLDYDLTIIELNSYCEIVTGYSKKEVLGKNVLDFLPPVVDDVVREHHYARFKNNDSTPKRYDLHFISKQGKHVDVIVTVGIIPGTGKSIISLIDVTDMNKAKEVLQVALDEKDVLLREIHHRVKNNMQVISSLINLQSNIIKDDFKYKYIFEDCQLRIQSMAFIHEQLYNSDNLSVLNFKEYILNTVKHLEYSLYTPDREVSVNFDLNDVYLDIDLAIPCGFILTELVTNSFKHAFKDKTDGNIDISIIEKDYNVILTIEDNGSGFDLDNLREGSLGLKLVYSLVDQVDGDLEVKSDENGSKFILTFRSVFNDRI
jgi:PAS domain S-box-containing protein